MDRYKNGWCGMCNKPAIGRGQRPDKFGKASNTFIKVCDIHKDKVLNLHKYSRGENGETKYSSN